MSREVFRDSLAVINGPEDGNMYSISPAPCYVGSDISCAVLLRLDRAVQPQHVMLTPVAGGYRVRCVTGSPAYVEGRPVRRVRSQIIRPGGELRVGHTRMTLKCSADGLAERYRGVDFNGDLAWALRDLAARAQSGLAGALSLVVSMLFALMRNWKVTVPIALVGGYLFVPPVRNMILWGIYYVRVALIRAGIGS